VCSIRGEHLLLLSRYVNLNSIAIGCFSGTDVHSLLFSSLLSPRQASLVCRQRGKLQLHPVTPHLTIAEKRRPTSAMFSTDSTILLVLYAFHGWSRRDWRIMQAGHFLLAQEGALFMATMRTMRTHILHYFTCTWLM